MIPRILILALIVSLCSACDVKGYPSGLMWQNQPVRLLVAVPRKAERWTVRPGSIVWKRVGSAMVRAQAGETFAAGDQVAAYVGGCIVPQGGTCEDEGAPRFGVASATNFDPVLRCFLDTDLPSFVSNKCVLDEVNDEGVQVFTDVPAEMGGPAAIPPPPLSIFD